MADDQERRDARAEAAQDLIQASMTDAELKLLADRHIAALIKEHLIPDLDMMGPTFLLLDEACQRLEASNRKRRK